MCTRKKKGQSLDHAGRFVPRIGGVAPALVGLALLAVGCAHEAPFVWVQDVAVADQAPVTRLQARDTISIAIAGQPSLSGESTVRDDGSYFNPLVGSVALVGLTLAEAGKALRDRMKAVVVEPVVSVALVRSGPIRVGVMGEVKTPGSYELTRDRRLSAALLAAGWLTDFAHDDRIFVLRTTGDSRRIRFRLRDLTISEPHAVSFLLLDGDIVSVE
jgi:polysaccharide export outer membrane protein